jgi:hypothetical protein
MQRQALRAIAHGIALRLVESHASGPAPREVIDWELSIACQDPRNGGMTDAEREHIAAVLIPRDLPKVQRKQNEGIAACN